MKKISFRQILISWFTSHPWLKLIALILAILTWFYVSAEINKYY